MMIYSHAFALAVRKDSTNAAVRYYYQMREAEFEELILPKEQFLLVLSKNVTEEIESRKFEGLEFSDLFINQLAPPEESVNSAYGQELSRIILLLKEIQKMEFRAKKQSNINVLESLTGLKNKIKGILNVQAEDQLALFGQIDSTGAVVAPQDTLVREPDMPEFDRPDQHVLESGDLFDQWKYNRLLEYEVHLTRFKLIRAKLLGHASEKQTTRMFRRDLKRALEEYNAGHYMLSRLILQDIIDYYPDIHVLDDVLFYASESAYALHYFDEALDGYHQIVRDYPQSPFLSMALLKILNVNYLLGKNKELLEGFALLRDHVDQIDAQAWGRAAYLVAYTYFKQNDYRKALRLFTAVPIGTEYDYPAQYLAASCYSNLGDDEAALGIYQTLLLTKNSGQKDLLLAQIQNNVLLKLGFLYYERGNLQRAMEYFQRVSATFGNYDLSRLGLAWSAYQSGKPVLALNSAESILKNSMVSDYLYEAKVLAANAKNILGFKDEALKDLKSVYLVGSKAEALQELDSEADVTDPQSQDLALMREQELLTAARKIQKVLTGSSTLGGAFREAKNNPESDSFIRREIAGLDQIASNASGRDSLSIINEVKRIQKEMRGVLETQASQDEEKEGVSDPLLQKMGMKEYLRFLFDYLLNETLEEKKRTRSGMDMARQLAKEAAAQDNFSLQIRLEIKLEELRDYHARLNQYEIWLRENKPEGARLNLNQWASFSGYGISNINFSRIKSIEGRMSRISELMTSLDNVYALKKEIINQKIQNLMSDVSKIERKMNWEVTQKREREREAYFRDQYFQRLNTEPIGEVQKGAGKKNQ